MSYVTYQPFVFRMRLVFSDIFISFRPSDRRTGGRRSDPFTQPLQKRRTGAGSGKPGQSGQTTITQQKETPPPKKTRLWLWLSVIMSGKKRTFDVGARVFAKVRGYPAWPARVETVASGGAKYGVFFYGTYESATCKANELWPFDEDTKAKFGKNKKKNFDVAMLEIEGNPGIKTAEMLMEEAQKEGGGGIEGGEQETPADAEAVAPTAAPAVEEEAPAAPATPQEKKTPARGRRKSGGEDVLTLLNKDKDFFKIKTLLTSF